LICQLAQAGGNRALIVVQTIRDLVLSLSRRLILIALAAAALVAAPAAATPGVASPDDMSLGDPKAPVQVVEYASMACPHCAHFNETVFPTLKAKYIDTGKVRYTLKEFLTAPQEVAAAGFMLARCAGPEKYFKVVDEVFRSQPRWRSEPISDVFLGIAKANGLTQEQFEACLTDADERQKLNARVLRSVDEGVNSTPTVYVNGKELQAFELADVEAAIQAALAKGAPAKPGRKP
jgi:protein-disulfide isomerase